MSPAKSVATIDESASAPATVGGESIDSFIDENSLKAQYDKAAMQNRETCRPFRVYQKMVIDKAGVPNTQQTREIASHVCGAVARLPFVPDSEEIVETVNDMPLTEFDQQVIRTAQYAEKMLDSEMVWTVSARKLSKAALQLRKEDPDGSKGIAWVNDTREDEASVLDV